MTRRQPAPAPDLPGFSYVELLGSGGFADVYKYTQLGLGRQVAVKVMVGGVDDAELVAFQSEANVMAQLSNHPSIVSIYQADVTPDGRAFLVMEYCPPPHLGVQIRTRPLSVSKALEVTIQLAGATETAHRLGILHRDIKPANILFTEFGRPALTDFGISVSTVSGASAQGIGMSVPWAPPEQLSTGMPMGAPGDVYSLAATLWTALASRPPFHVLGGANDPLAMAPRVRRQQVPPTGRADVPESLERVLRTAMAKSPNDRFATALEFARSLQAVQAELHQPVTSIDVRNDPLPTEASDDPQGGTRITSFVSIDPDASGPHSSRKTVESPAAASAAETTSPPVAAASSLNENTLMRSLSATDEQVAFSAGQRATVDPVAPSGEKAAHVSRRGVLVAVAGVGLVAAIAATLLIRGLTGDGVKGTTDDHRDPQHNSAANPLGDAVPPPTSVAVTRGKGPSLDVSWTNPKPLAGDKFGYRLEDPETARAWSYTANTTAQLESAPGRSCVQVQLVRSDGRASNSVVRCPGKETP